MADSTQCDSENPVQNVKHIVQECPLRKFQGTWDDIFTASPEAITWIESLDFKPQTLIKTTVMLLTIVNIVSIFVKSMCIRSKLKAFFVLCCSG